MRRIGLSAALVAMLLASPAVAGVLVIGKGAARQCYEAAEFSRPADLGLAACDEALSQNITTDERAATFVNRGILFMRSGDPARGIEDYDRALAIRPSLPEAFLNKGIALVKTGQDARGIELLGRALDLGPNRPEVALYARGIAHELLGDARAAFSDYRAAAALRPDWAEPREQLARFQVVPRKP